MSFAMSNAVRVSVPLKSMCSMRWEMPERSGVARTNTPAETDLTAGLGATTSFNPLSKAINSFMPLLYHISPPAQT